MRTVQLQKILRVIVTIKPIGVPDHPPAGGRVGIDIVGELATEQRKQGVGISDCAADPRRVGTVGDVELRHDQLPGQH